VKKTDEKGGRAYSCMAINYFMRDNAIGPEHVVEVLGSKYNSGKCLVTGIVVNKQFNLLWITANCYIYCHI